MLDGRIAPRSGLAAKHGIGVNAGVIDADYTGHVRVILMNFSDKDFEVKEGDRIAQLIVERVIVSANYVRMLRLPCADCSIADIHARDRRSRTAAKQRQRRQRVWQHGWLRGRHFQWRIARTRTHQRAAWS